MSSQLAAAMAGRRPAEKINWRGPPIAKNQGDFCILFIYFYQLQTRPSTASSVLPRRKKINKYSVFLKENSLREGGIAPRLAQKKRAQRASLMARSRCNPALPIARYRSFSEAFQKHPPFSCRSVFLSPLWANREEGHIQQTPVCDQRSFKIKRTDK